ncbi:MAG: DUF3592 domain-containing protein [Pseudobutyrivibrio sp.]|nr:DUF3592 domain-containing protein [Pseudobutyrivibrio sp.]
MKLGNKIFTILGTVFTFVGVLVFVLGIFLYVKTSSMSDFSGDPVAGILIGGIVGATFIIAGIPFIIVPHAIKKKNENLIANGRKLVGEVEEIGLNYQVMINGRHPYIVYAKYVDPTYGYIYKFKSGSVYFNPHDSYDIGDSIDIYVDPSNMKKHYVDVKDKLGDMVRDFT